jgi:hypothetical protein
LLIGDGLVQRLSKRYLAELHLDLHFPYARNAQKDYSRGIPQH